MRTKAEDAVIVIVAKSYGAPVIPSSRRNRLRVSYAWPRTWGAEVEAYGPNAFSPVLAILAVVSCDPSEMTARERMSAAVRLSALLKAGDERALRRLAKGPSGNNLTLADLRLARALLEELAVRMWSSPAEARGPLERALEALVADDEEEDEAETLPPAAPATPIDVDDPAAPRRPQLDQVPTSPPPVVRSERRVTSPWAAGSAQAATTSRQAPPVAPVVSDARPWPVPPVLPASSPSVARPMRLDPDGATVACEGTPPREALPFGKGEGAGSGAVASPAPGKISPDGATLQVDDPVSEPALPFVPEGDSSS